MIAIDAQVKIVNSDELAAMRLTGIVGQRGRVVEQIFGADSKPIGYMACLDAPFQGECLWFVPENAIEDDTDRK